MLNDRPRVLRALLMVERWDPLSFILFAHGLAMALAGETDAPLAVVVLSGAIGVIRLCLGWLLPEGASPRIRFGRAVITLVLSFVVIVVDGGTNSPFFFWILLILGWHALGLDPVRFLRLGVITITTYVVALVVDGDWSAATLARGGLLASFIFILALGRWILARREAEVARLDEVVTAIIENSPLALAVFDADRDRTLYANAAAHEMGIADRDSMATLVLAEPAPPQRVVTLAELVVGAGFANSPMRPYRQIRSDNGEGYRIGFHPLRAEDAPPVVLVYGLTAEEHGP